MRSNTIFRSFLVWGLSLYGLLTSLTSCQAATEDGLDGSGNSVAGGTPTPLRSLVLIYGLDPTPGQSYREGAVIPVFTASGVIAGPFHVVTVSHNVEALLQRPNLEYFVATNPDFTTQLDSIGQRWMFIHNHSNSTRLGYFVPFLTSLDNASKDDLARATGLGDDLAVFVTDEGQAAFPSHAIAPIRRPQDGDPAALQPAGTASCSFATAGMGLPEYKRHQFNTCVFRFPESETPFTLGVDQPLFLLLPNDSRISPPSTIKADGHGCSGDSGGPVFDAKGRIIGLYQGRVENPNNTSCEFPGPQNQVAVATNITTKRNWSSIDRVLRLCDQSTGWKRCQQLIEASTCGNLGSQAGFVQTDLECRPAGTPLPGNTWVSIPGATDCGACFGHQWLVNQPASP